jgi:hypothetical protein
MAGGMFRQQMVEMWMGYVGSNLAHDRAMHLRVRCTRLMSHSSYKARLFAAYLVVGDIP